MPNRLSQSDSPFLLQHADNPVEWYPWGPEALERARLDDKPIFLSIGYSACHWCHVMNRESFQHQPTADIMNAAYVSIKVDREERPDLDKIYLQSLMLILGNAGWPLNVWLTPDLKPFHGATYLPHIPSPGVPSLAQQLLFLADAWKKKRDEVEASAQRVAQVLQAMSSIQAPAIDDKSGWLAEAVKGCELLYDDKHGGFGQAPKFPQPLVLRFLLLRAKDTKDKELFELVDHTAQAMGRGGLFDQLGGGFHRYAVDPQWTIPHFEKMLYDNAQMCSFYAELYEHTKTPFYKWIVDSLVLWLERDMLLDNGGFCSSTDAEAEHEEGRAFVWTQEQLREALDDNESQMFASFFQVTSPGNFTAQKSVLTQRKPISKCAKELGWDFDLAVRVLESAREKAFDARMLRVQPGRDEKVICFGNAQMISALCLAHRLTQTEDALELATKASEFLLTHFANRSSDSTYPRVWANGKTYGTALSEDLSAMVLAFLDMHELVGDDRYLNKAKELYQHLVAKFWDSEKHLTAQTDPVTIDLLMRPYSFEDNPSPSGNSLFLECSRRMVVINNDPEALSRLKAGILKVASVAVAAPTSFGEALRTAHLLERLPVEV